MLILIYFPKASTLVDLVLDTSWRERSHQRHGLRSREPTWRASADWGARLGYAAADIAAVNAEAISLMRDLQRAHAASTLPMVVSGCVGPRGDGYVSGEVMSEGEAIGIARAALKAGMPAALSFTVETDVRLPTGQTLTEAIEAVDAATANGPAYYMINCAPPSKE